MHLAEVDINKVVDGVCTAIHDEFGDDHKVYTDTVEQGFVPGSFFVKLLQVTDDRFLDERYLRNHTFAVQYMPVDDRNAQAECWGVAERLDKALRYIRVNGDLTEGTGISPELTDGFLTETVNYRFFVRVPRESDPMEVHIAEVKVNE